jgi:dolichol-phosphate mannosyltransferase
MKNVKQKKTITIITPVFNEENNLREYYQEVTLKLAAETNYNFTFLLVDDGSTDRSWEIILDLCRMDAKFSAVRLSRNFGSHVAITAGMDRAQGDAIVVLACDLQDPVDTVIMFIREWEKGGEIVWGKRITRGDPLWRIIASKLFETIIRKWIMPRNSIFATGTFLLFDKKILECFKLYNDTSRLTFLMIALTGFRQTSVNYHRIPRARGKSGWKLSAMFSSFYSSIVGYSIAPLKLISTVSIINFFLAIAMLIVLLYLFFNQKTENLGWVSTVFLIVVYNSVNFLILGILGEYLSRIYRDSARRPLYFVAEDTISERYQVSRPGRVDDEHR